MKKHLKVAVLPGDGIGPEVMSEACRVLERVGEKYGFHLALESFRVGGAALDHDGVALPAETLQACEASGAILFGSVGGPKWESLPPDQQPERAALLPLRKHFGLFANLRPVRCLAELTHSSPLKESIVAGGFDILCVRELTGGLYFGQPKLREIRDGEPIAVDTMIYRRSEIERIAHVAFQAARDRRGILTSIDKANVLENGILWRETVTHLAKSYPEVRVNHLLVDNAAMQLIKNPKAFDVVLAENLFGDILSDELAMLAGSLGMLPSASLGQETGSGVRFGMYEPSGGTAPDIAGRGIANPIAQILSAALMLRHSFGETEAAGAIEEAVRQAIVQGYRTIDIQSEGKQLVGTSEMGDAILANL